MKLNLAALPKGLVWMIFEAGCKLSASVAMLENAEPMLTEDEKEAAAWEDWTAFVRETQAVDTMHARRALFERWWAEQVHQG